MRPRNSEYVRTASGRASLGGRVSWLEHVHPEHGAKVRAEFDRIVW